MDDKPCTTSISKPLENHLSENQRQKYIIHGIPTRKLLVTCIPANATREQLKSEFSIYGEIKSCILKKGNIFKTGYAFITYATLESAVSAITVGSGNGILLLGHQLNVIPADFWHQPDRLEAEKTFHDMLHSINYFNCIIESKDTPIHTLNNDCLMHIFSYLNITDKIRIERVCKRWLTVSLQSWQSFKKLDLMPTSWWNIKLNNGISKNLSKSFWEEMLAKVEPEHKILITPQILYKVLCKCGYYLKDIDLSLNCFDVTCSITNVIAKLCPNVQRLYINELKITGSAIRALARSCKNLTSLKISMESIWRSRKLDVTGVQCSDGIELLLFNNKKLECLNIDILSDDILFDVPYEQLKEVSLLFFHASKYHVFDEQPHQKFYHKLKNLRKLRITVDSGSEIKLYFRAIHTLLEANASTLEVLELISEDVDHPDAIYDLSHDTLSKEILTVVNLIAKLPKLKSLRFHGASILNEKFLVTILKQNKQLSSLSIGDYDIIDSSYIRTALASLPKIEHLHFYETRNVEVMKFTKMPHLKTLHCLNSYISPKSTIFLESLQSLENLEVLDVSGSNVSNKFICAANDIHGKKLKNKKLRIYANRTKVNLKKIKKPLDFLEVIDDNTKIIL